MVRGVVCSGSALGGPSWRNRLARSAVNRKVGGSSPPEGDCTFCGPVALVSHQMLRCNMDGVRVWCGALLCVGLEGWWVGGHWT